MNRYVAIIFSFLLTIQTWSVNIVVDGITYTINEKSHIAYVNGKNCSGDIFIPNKIVYNSESYDVDTSIGNGVFTDCIGLKSITLPDNVNVGSEAFKGCTSLESITFGSITKIATNAFTGCTNLKSVYISDLKSWCNLQFYKKEGSLAYGTLHYTYIYNNPLEYGADLYVKGEKLTNFVIPDSITIISPYAFIGCGSIERLEIPATVSVSVGAFGGCNNLRKVVSYASLSTSQVSGNSLDSLYLYSSFGNSNYAKFYTPHFVYLNYVGDYSNADSYSRLSYLFPNVKEYQLSESIKSIGAYAFRDCDSLQMINIPPSVISIRNGAFQNCNNINHVEISDLAAWCGITFEDNPLRGADLYLNKVKQTKLEIPLSVTEINSHAFSGCNSIESVEIPKNVKSIGNGTFANCPNLSHISLPDNEIKFSSYCFSNCPLLISAGPKGSCCSVEYEWKDRIPANFLYYCSGITKVLIPSTITSIGERAFYGCSNIKDVYIDALVPPTVESNAFSAYGNLYVPKGTKMAYSSADVWKKFNIIELIDIEDISIQQKRYDIKVGDSLQLQTIINPNNATYQTVYWSVDDEEYASINQNGVVTGLKTGKVTVYAKTTDGTELTASCDVYVTNPVSEVHLDKQEITLEVDGSAIITATCVPANADDVSIVWSSMNEDIAIVSDGKITANRLGTTEITATAVSGVVAKCSINVVPTPVISVYLNQHSTTMYTENTMQLVADILPQKATYKTINWTSSKPSVATVDENGKVTAVSNGTAKIYARSTDDTNLCDSCTVTVKTLAKSIQMSKSSLDMIVGEQMSLSTTVRPATTSDKRCTWTSSNPNVATVSSSGNVTAVSTGVTTITATTIDGSNLTAKSSVTVTNPVISVSLNKQEASLYVGQTTTLIPYCIPENADNTNITWASSNETTAVVQNGVVTAKALGTAVISATSVTGKTAKCTVNVVPTPAAGIILNAMTLAMTVDEQFNLTATVKPDDTTNKTVKWTSNNVNVVAVSSDGKVTAKKSGTAIITVRTTDGSSLSATCTIVVTSPVRAISMNKQEAGMFVGESVQITASCSPQDADNTTVAWTSSNNNIATVSKDGKIKAVGAGVATITATTTDGTNLSASCRVTVSKNNQTITWNQTFTDIAYGGEMIPLDATATSGMKIRYKLNDESVAVIFDLGDVVYLNPANCGKTTITAWQEGNYAYEKTEMTKEVTVTDKVCNQMSTLVAYYSNSSAVSSIVVELANQLAHTSTSVTTKDIKSVNGEMNLADYDAVVMVYPLCDGHMAEPMLNFLNANSKSMTGKAVSYVEYGEKNVTSANAKALHITVDDLERKDDLISEWIYRQQPTSIQSISSGKATANNMHDLQGRKLTKAPRRGIYIENGIKKIR